MVFVHVQLSQNTVSHHANLLDSKASKRRNQTSSKIRKGLFGTTKESIQC